MQSIEIRALDIADFDIWLPLWKNYQRFYQVDIPEAVTLETWARFLDSREPMYAALAIAGEQALGLVHLIYHRSTWTSGNYCYLQDLFVTDNARGRGVGRALIEHVFSEARRNGTPRVHWLTHESNDNAMQFYDRIVDRSGFVQYRKQFT
ncbi:GNAT family N-acetyltransferase [Paraburkholderia terrae]|uniref:GNAT family N-acetyltransferase n=1 Tax=Paraburkholderia terrae TaxID=311230 RepID=UPI00206D2B41|nr:GNAT family N-acetyltransferase [Paraburkholderia terrae]BDC45185.1 N-acetyltransferase [Paraburkholderia terrae]